MADESKKEEIANQKEIISLAQLQLEVEERAEKENCWIFRLVERYGQTGIAQIELLESEARVQETNLLEWEDMGGLLTSPLTLKFKPFEIRTFKIRSGLRQGPS